MDTKAKPDQSEDVQAHIRVGHKLHEDDERNDEQELRRGHLNEQDDDVEAHSMIVDVEDRSTRR